MKAARNVMGGFHQPAQLDSFRVSEFA